MQPNPQQLHYWDAIQKTPASNATGEEIPAYGLIELEGWDGNGFKAFKPRTDNCYVFVNGPVPIPATKTGSVNPVGQVASRARVYIATDGTAASGDTWGAQANSFLAKSGNTGFLILDNDASVSGMAWAEPVAASSSSPDTNLFVKITAGDDYIGYGGVTDWLCAAHPTTYDPTTLTWIDDTSTLCYVRGSSFIGAQAATTGVYSFDIGQRYAAKKVGQVQTSMGVYYDLYEADSNASEDTSGVSYSGLISAANNNGITYAAQYKQYIGGVKIFREPVYFQGLNAFNDAGNVAYPFWYFETQNALGSSSFGIDATGFASVPAGQTASFGIFDNTFPTGVGTGMSINGPGAGIALITVTGTSGVNSIINVAALSIFGGNGFAGMAKTLSGAAAFGNSNGGGFWFQGNGGSPDGLVAAAGFAISTGGGNADVGGTTSVTYVSAVTPTIVGGFVTGITVTTSTLVFEGGLFMKTTTP